LSEDGLAIAIDILTIIIIHKEHKHVAHSMKSSRGSSYT